MKKNKQLIRCPVCEGKGVDEVLAELSDEDMKVLRFKGGYTTITGAHFAIICGRCNEVVFTRNEL